MRGGWRLNFPGKIPPEQWILCKSEQRAKPEGPRLKKKLEGDIIELEIGVDHWTRLSRPTVKAGKAIKRYQGQPREVEVYEEDEMQAEILDLANLADWRANALQAVTEMSAINSNASGGGEGT